MAQLREEAVAKSKANREETINKRRGSIGGSTPVPSSGASTVHKGLTPVSSRRGSTGGIRCADVPSVVDPASAPGGTASVEEILSEEEQEPDKMPGSGKKKRHASASKPMVEDSSDGVDKDLKAFLIAMKDDINKATNAAVDRIDRRIDENAKQIGEIKQDMERRDAGISARISTEVRQEVAKLSGLLKGKSPALEPSEGVRNRRDRAYNHCRRSLKIWPIRGENMEDEVKNFMANKLNFDQRKIESLGAIEVVVAPGRLAKDKGEVLATFETKEDRDTVEAGGVNLAGQREAGMSIHVPGHLMDNLIALNGIGYSIKTKNAGVKRAVKFDDIIQDVYLDICINGNWRRITPKEARSVMEKIPATTSGATGGLSLSLEDLSNLVQGEAVAGLTAVVVPEEEGEQ